MSTPLKCVCKRLAVVNPNCPVHGTSVRTAPDFYIDGKSYEGECIFPDLWVKP